MNLFFNRCRLFVENGLWHRYNNGKYKSTEIFVMADEYERELQELAKTTKLPDEPDYSAIQELVLRINRRVMERQPIERV